MSVLPAARHPKTPRRAGSVRAAARRRIRLNHRAAAAHADALDDAYEPLWSLQAPSHPLLDLEPARRALAVLLVNGEPPRLVAAHLGRRSVLRELALIALELAPAVLPPRRPRIARILPILPDHRHRWPFVLRASGFFPQIPDIADALGLHRANVYRALADASAAVTAWPSRHATPLDHAIAKAAAAGARPLRSRITD